MVATADTDARTIALTPPDGDTVTVDVVAARAAAVLLSHVVCGVLQPEGPFLAIEADTDCGWLDLREAR